MADTRRLEDLAPTADLRPLAPPPEDKARSGVIANVRAVLPGLGLVVVCVAAAHLVTRVLPSVSPLVAAVVIGALLANVGLLPDWARAGMHFAAKRLLRLGVVLLGFKLAVGDVLALGGPGLIVVALVVGTTFFGTQWLGRRMGVSRSLSLLIATGFSICGASAVAAVEGVAEADEEEVAFSIGLVTLFGSLAIAVLPALGGLLGLTGSAFGAWAGASVHDVAQVVATASTAGPMALNTAVIVKLTRVVLLAPLVAGITINRRRRAPTTGSTPSVSAPAAPPILPLFVVGFLAAVALRSMAVVPTGWLGPIGTVETLTLAAALVGLGTGTQIAKLRHLGGRPLLLALASWVLVALASYLGVVVVGM